MKGSRQGHNIVRRSEADHFKTVSRQRNDLKALGKLGGCKLVRIRLLCHQELVPQRLRRKAAVKKRRLEQCVARKVALNAGRIDLASRSAPEDICAADVVGVGMGAQYRAQRPAVFVKYLPNLAPGSLSFPLSDKINALIYVEIKPDLGRAVNIISVV